MNAPAPVLASDSRSGPTAARRPSSSSINSIPGVPATSRMSNASPPGQTADLMNRKPTSSRPALSSTSTTNHTGSRTPHILSNAARLDTPLLPPVLSSATTPRSNPTPEPRGRMTPSDASSLPQRPSIPDITMSDLQNVIAAQELTAMSSHHRANAFYSSIPPSASTLPRPPSRKPRGDGHLRLYRQPPPWKLLDDPPPSPAPPQGAVALRRMELPTFVQGANKQARKNMEGLQNMVAQRLKVAPTTSSIRRADGFDDASTSGPSRTSTTSFQPKNPFTARFSGARPSEPSSSSRPPMSSKSKRPMSTSVFVGSSSLDGQPPTKKLAVEPPRHSRPSVGSATSMKPLVPISTISVPDLPEEVKKQHAQNEKAARRSLGGCGPSSSKSKTKADVLRRSSLPASGSKSNASSGSSSITTKAKSAKATSAKPSKSKKSPGSSGGGAQQSGGFDWGSWSKPAGD